MPAIIADMTMSLDGFIADPDDGVDELFGWFGNGDVEIPTADDHWTFKVTEASAPGLRDAMQHTGALIAGRRLFDVAGGWGGMHPMGVPVFVVTHSIPDGWPREDAPFTFVTDGVRSAVTQAQAVAGERNVAVASPTIAQQCLNEGLLDAISVHVVPVLLGRGIRFFDNLAHPPIQLADPRVTEGRAVTHLYYPVRREDA